MRILTWNINSVRLRMPLLRKLVQHTNPDVVCLQETKVVNDKFPLDEIAEEGYVHAHIDGMKSYNGVAILSKHEFNQTHVHDRVNKKDCRHISVNLPSKQGMNFDIHCVYVPAGGDEPDPEINDKFAHKLDFVDEMSEWYKNNHTSECPIIVAGDFNIAPLENDVWSHKQLLKVVSHTPIEVEKLSNFKESIRWVDAIRHFVPESEKCYTWWSYRNRDWKKSNRGRRLDHIWLTEPLVPFLKNHEILHEARDWERPSDHVPVLVDLEL
jgi:exodeoxyribonuclease-3